MKTMAFKGAFAAVGTQLPDGVAKFANIWQFGLKLPIDSDVPEGSFRLLA